MVSQVTVLVRSCVLPSLNVPVAFSCCVVPSANDEFAGVTAIESKAPDAPVPVRLTVGLTPALSEIVSVAARVPEAAGVKKTEIVQFAPAERVLGFRGHVVEVV